MEKVNIRGYKQGKIEAYDKCLELIDKILGELGRSNMVSKDELISLRNEINSLEEELDEKKI